MPVLQELFHWTPNEDGNGRYIIIEDFVIFLKTNRIAADKLKSVKPSNVFTEVSKYTDGTVKIYGKEAISLLSVVRYIFHHSDQMQVCRQTAERIIEESIMHGSTRVLQGSGTSHSTTKHIDKTIYDLYRRVVSSGLKTNLVQVDSNQLSNAAIPSLYGTFQQYFTPDEWKVIQLFEWHYGLHEQASPEVRLNLDVERDKKWKFFEFCQQTSELSQNFHKLIPSSISRRKKRFEAAEQAASVSISGFLNHRPEQVERSILQDFGDLIQNVQVIAIDHPASADDNSIDIVVEMSQSDITIETVLTAIVAACTKKHHLLCRRVIFLMPGSLEQFKQPKNIIRRFAIRDALASDGDLHSRIWCQKHPVVPDYLEQYAEVQHQDQHMCENCYDLSLPPALTTESFGVLQEWNFDVPLPIQIFLEAFINQNSLRRKDSTEEKQNYVTKQVERLYLTYDILLNTYNQMHVGIIQQVATDQLMMNFHSVGTVFEVTSKAGLTTCLVTAENKVMMQATDDRRYYETYLKGYPMTYNTLAGLVTKFVSMRQCLIILMLDNLVRLKTKEDPDPGDSRTKQICTIPITLQGLPKDHILIRSWHKPEMCDDTDNCPCKKEVTLTKEQIEEVLLMLTQDEGNILARFQSLSTWGCKPLWQHISGSSDGSESVFQIWLRLAKKTRSIQATLPQPIPPQDRAEKVITEAVTTGEDKESDNENEGDDDEYVQLMQDEESGNEDEDNDEYVQLMQEPDPCDDYEESTYLHLLKDAQLQEIEEWENEGIDNYDITDLERSMEVCLLQEDVGNSTDKELADSFNISCDMDDLSKDDSNHVFPSHLSTGDAVLNTASSLALSPTDRMHEDVGNSTDEELADSFNISCNINEALGDDSNPMLHVPPHHMSMGDAGGNPVSHLTLSPTNTTQLTEEDIDPLAFFDIKKFHPPDLLCRRPPAASGRDDDWLKLKEILDNQLVKLGYDATPSSDRILCGPDNKICANLLKLMNMDSKYKAFLPEFPVLHLRKSKINTLIRSYKDAGLGHLLRYMRDDSSKEITKLICLDHIDIATRHVRRLGQSLHLAFMVTFLAQLEDFEAEEVMSVIQGKNPQKWESWDQKFSNFITEGCKANATFSLHHDWMKHCDEIVALQLAERMGGSDGYKLLLAVVKSSLLLQYLNGASSYAPFCTQLLFEYYRCGPYHQSMKHCLFSTPIGNSTVNFATDTKREMDHLTAVKMLRAGSTDAAVLRRMSIVDSVSSVAELLHVHAGSTSPPTETELKWNFTNSDFIHVVPTTELILRKGGLSTHEDSVPYNVYAKDVIILSKSILDEQCKSVGEYLLKRFVAKQGMFGTSEKDIPSKDTITGPKDLVAKAKQSKGVTIRRTFKKANTTMKTIRQVKEEKRRKELAKKMKEADCLTSEMNTCQALVKPDCSKPKVDKSRTMPIALQHLLNQCESPDPLIILNRAHFSHDLVANISIVTIEFAGTKFKTTKDVKTGILYLRHIESNVLKPVFLLLKNVERIIICEEKYSYTPDDFKAATRKQREVKNSTCSSIAHLKAGDAIVSSGTFNKEAVITTAEGKLMISNYLAANMDKISPKRNVIIDVDSELHTEGCECQDANANCTCCTYATPIRCHFTADRGLVNTEKLQGIKQRKGEAELAQVDWMLSAHEDLQPDKAIASVLSSGDIDAVPIHLFAVSLHWPRNEDGTFKYPVYVFLQKKARHFDFYNITGIIEVLERKYGEPNVAVKVAVGLCMAGNDFVPKMYSMAHTKVLDLVMRDEFRNTLISVTPPQVEINEEVYIKLVKHLYCPKTKDCSKATFDEIREASIHGRQKASTNVTRNPQLWMPPQSVLHRVAKLITLQIEYLLTIGRPDAELPQFLSSGCLKKTDDGAIEYDFGEEAHAVVSGIVATAQRAQKRPNEDGTPRKGKGRKKAFLAQVTSTPVKNQRSRRRLVKN